MIPNQVSGAALPFCWVSGERRRDMKRLFVIMPALNEAESIGGVIREIPKEIVAHPNPLHKKGDILISMRNINSIATIDGETSEIVWLWGPTNLVFQHHPMLLDNGHILLFDNGTTQFRVLEIDPLSRQIVWHYGPKEGFFSATRGSNQRLPKGNTLISESDTGHVFEITPKGKTVWKFANPIVDAKKRREAIWRMERLDPTDLTFLN